MQVVFLWDFHRRINFTDSNAVVNTRLWPHKTIWNIVNVPWSDTGSKAKSTISMGHRVSFVPTQQPRVPSLKKQDRGERYKLIVVMVPAEAVRQAETRTRATKYRNYEHQKQVLPDQTKRQQNREFPPAASCHYWVWPTEHKRTGLDKFLHRQ